MYIKFFLPIFLLIFSGPSYSNLIEVIKPEIKNTLWLNAGMYSYHFDKEKELNNNNIGFGAEYAFSTVASVTGGTFKNSDDMHSSYLGFYYHPIAISFFKLGFVAGGMSGYLSTNNGGWFPALIPTVSVESKWLGANLFLIPSVGDRVHGAIALQLKFRVLDQ